MCKNGGCGHAYESPATNLTTCVHHPGVPVFHEGLKYWSCCTKRTSDFAQFLAQRGCQSGQHRWQKNVCILSVSYVCLPDLNRSMRKYVEYFHKKSV